MTAQSSIPLKWYVPFAQGDSARVELPVTTSDATRASQTLGFPPLTMQPPESGGVPPQGEDFNGGMNQIARIAWWTLNGGGWPYDATFATNSNINGYPNGAKLQSADFRGDWINTSDNNQVNPDTNGTGWVPGFQYGTTALTGQTGGTVTPTPLQAAKNSITISGTLTSALTVILPTWLRNWTITNSTTGAFVLIVKTASGSGVTIPQNAAPTRVSGDGTNIVQASENVAAATSSTQAMQYGQATGRLLNVRIFTASTTYTPTVGTNSIVVEIQGGGGGSGGAPGTAAAQVAVGSPGASGGYVKHYMTTGFSGAAIVVGAAGAAGTAGAAGGNGGASSFGAITAGGGGFGNINGPGTIVTSASASGGTASGGNVLNINGVGSANSIASQTIGLLAPAPGAASVLSPGATIAQPAVGFGGGGGGTTNGASAAAIVGKLGAPGVVIVTEYA